MPASAPKFELLSSLLKSGDFGESQAAPLADSLVGELEMLKVALDQSSIVAFTDAAGTITHVNENFCKISGYSREELLGQNHRIINSGYHPREFFQSLWKTIAGGKVWRGEVRNRKKDGSYYWVDSTIIPFSKVGPYGSRYMAIRNDISEQKRVEEELQQERARLLHAEKLASLGELTAGIAHELGNPIAAIQGRAEILKMHAASSSPQLQDQALKAVDAILRLTDRMGGVLRSMTSLAREGSSDPFIVQPLGPILENTLDYGSEKFRRREIQVTLEPVSSDLKVECRDTQIIQILVNLVNNASDAIQNLPSRWIKVAAKRNGEFAEITVTDSGAGIPDDVRGRIFTPFFTTKPSGKGTGLGLHIAHSLAQQHGGSLTIDAAHPNTRFVLSLPLRQPSTQPQATR